MKPAKSKIIITQKIIEKTLNRFEKIPETEHLKLTTRFMEEQPVLFEFVAHVVHENSKKYASEFLMDIILIWQFFETAAGTVPLITEEIFEKIDSKPNKQLEKLSQILGISDESILEQKLNEFNEIILNVTSEQEMVKARKNYGKNFDKISEVVRSYIDDISHPDLFAFVMEQSESSQLSNKKNPNQEQLLADDLLFVVDCFNEAVNSKPFMKIV